MSNPYGEHVPDPTSPSGFRWRRYDEPDVTQIQPVVGSPDRVPPDDLTSADNLVEPSYNGLRPEDRQYLQPPQDPNWRPDADS